MMERRIDERALALASSDGFVQISVEDMGPGLGDGLADRIFEPFFTTKPEGLGIGLSICRSIIEAHGGSISAANNPARGSTLRFTVPLAREGTGDEYAR